MKKGNFYINMFLVNCGTKRQAREVSGYIDEENQIGYYKNKDNEWVSTDMTSGFAICTKSKLKDCKAATIHILSVIARKRDEENYKKEAKRFETLIEDSENERATA